MSRVSMLSRLFGKGSASKASMRPLWHRMVEIAREKAWYAQYGIADTVPGRFDAVTMVMTLVMLRMERDKAEDDRLIAPSVRLTELFVDDMDGQLRQSGVGDLVVGKRMGKLMGVLGGRIGAFREGLASDDTVLIPVLERNVTLIDLADKALLAVEVRKLHAQIDALANEDLMAGRIVR